MCRSVANIYTTAQELPVAEDAQVIGYGEGGERKHGAEERSVRLRRERHRRQACWQRRVGDTCAQYPVSFADELV